MLLGSGLAISSSEWGIILLAKSVKVAVNVLSIVVWPLICETPALIALTVIVGARGCGVRLIFVTTIVLPIETSEEA